MGSFLFLFIVVTMMIALLCATLYERYKEAKEFNNQVCPKCGYLLTLFVGDEKTNRGYWRCTKLTCNFTLHTKWIKLK